ncbi:ABC transporter permease [Lichenicoccus roseus]|uniref:Iron export ABC transporter permease subunit FetB n=1 Tax=Lichenicoccus roseus TaxID=2683649 RepID=A0A5R9J0A2_9PROT|nr:iron export ABC transporter permease subunit FetB [Lichenicoccus roseus]TLU71104.1 iron export ABC transporter permease subunit FetB [Lichenicoccus roseus]
MTTVSLSPLDLGAAGLLLAVEAGLSLVCNLGLHRLVLIAVTRMVIQLLLIGYVLRLIFSLASPALLLLAIGLMTLVAAREVAARSERQLRRQGNLMVGLASVTSATVTTTLLALTTAIRPHPWWSPQYAIPLVGIVLGSVLNAASLSLDHVLETVTRDRVAIETQLALGVGYRQATGPLLRAALRRGMLPIVNQMSAAGLITLPGIMTGQILAGLDPVQAVKYQILLMLLLAGSSVFASGLTAMLALRRLTDGRQRLRLDRLILATAPTVATAIASMRADWRRRLQR